MLSHVAEIAALVGRFEVLGAAGKVPVLRRENRISSIHSSLAIENNSLTLEQVAAVFARKRVLGPPRDVQEVKNDFAAYEAMETWRSSSAKDLLAAHRLL